MLNYQRISWFIIPLTIDISPTKTIVKLELFAPTERYLMIMGKMAGDWPYGINK